MWNRLVSLASQNKDLVVGITAGITDGILEAVMPMTDSIANGSSSSASFLGTSESPRFDLITTGTVVSLKGLTKVPERNGHRGVIRQYLPDSGRYVVELEDSEETMIVEAVNLIQHVHVRIHDVESKPELNGKIGSILTWLSDKERYNIYVEALKIVVSLKPGNVVLFNGTVAQITGVQSKPELNGKWGTIKEWIRESNKYDVQLSDQHVIRLKVENMRV
jgi:hypothetical protein